MTRSALRVFLGRLALASPLIVASGCDECHTIPAWTEVVALDPTPDGGTCDPAMDCTNVAPCGVARSCEYSATDGGVVALCHYPEIPHVCGAGCTGRRPAGLPHGGLHRAAGGIGEHFAQMAYLEAASVIAFERLADELSLHGAPDRLVAAARRAASDEVRHARMTAAFAGAHEAAPPPVLLPPAAARSLEALAIENAVEGCVNESFGAALAWWQSRHAAVAAVRAMMRTIAADERRHGDLAWAISDWLSQRLAPAARARVAQARTDALGALAESLRHEPDPAFAAAAGLPSARVAMGILDLGKATLWS